MDTHIRLGSPSLLLDDAQQHLEIWLWVEIFALTRMTSNVGKQH